MRLSAGMWISRTYSEGLMSSFYRFLARFSGRRRGGHMRAGTMRISLLPFFSLLVLHFFSPLVEGCSSRSMPKPRPPAVPSTSRPSVNFSTYPCTPQHAAYYCLNGGTCYAVKIGEDLLPYCECADGYVGERCDFKDLDGTYLSSRRRVMLETASIASGATVAVFLVVVICTFLYVRVQRKYKQNLTISTSQSQNTDEENQRPYHKQSKVTWLDNEPIRKLPIIPGCQHSRIYVTAEVREDLEKRTVSQRGEGLSYPIHHISSERGAGEISLAVYNVRVNTEPP